MKYSSQSVLLLHRLEDVLNQFDSESSLQKELILQKFDISRISNPKHLCRFHEVACFLRAYPDNSSILRLAITTLDNFESLVKRIIRRNRDTLDDTGIIGTTTHYPFSYQVAKYLVAKYPDELSIDWHKLDKKELEILENFLPSFIDPLEEDTIDNITTSLQDWMKHIASLENKTDISWLIDRIKMAQITEKAREEIYEIMNLGLKLPLSKKTISRTAAHLDADSDIFYQKTPLLRGGLEPLKIIKEPLKEVRSVSKRLGKKFIDISVSALSVRNREIYPLFYANSKDVMIIPVGRGVKIILIGMIASRRFPVETCYFFLIIRNNVPVGYGCGTMLFEQAEIAANIFDSFRSGESAYIYIQLMRVFHHILGAQVFYLEKYQVGAYGNKEAIKSGAFWFYYKLGFLPVTPETKKLATSEYLKIKRDHSYRSNSAVLVKLAKSDLRFYLTSGKSYAEKYQPGGIGLTYSTADKERNLKILSGFLPLNNIKKIPCDERYWLEVYAPFLCTYRNDISRWDNKSKKILIDIIRAKGRTSELDYIHHLNRHNIFKKLLIKASQNRD